MNMEATKAETTAQQTRGAEAASCCGTEKLEVCCAPEEKTLCCGAEARAPKSCGCN
jgi:hypothetical protein